MPLDLNSSPYFDDYDAKKKFMQLVFNPSYAVQARELTQIQSILQNQISVGSNHTFKDGTPIIGCEIRHNINKSSIILDDLDTAGLGVNINAFIDATVYAVDHPTDINALNNGSWAEITNVDVATKTILFNYKGGTFVDGDRLVIRDPDTNAILYDATIKTGSITEGVTVEIQEGILYIGGYFVQIDQQQIVVDWRSNDGTYHIGYSYNDTIITVNDDATLRDPANGSYNYNASGADRYKIDTKLDSWIEVQGTGGDVVSTMPTDFYNLKTIINTEVFESFIKVQYGDIIDLFARRTFDESGNYTTKYFEIGLEFDDVDSTNVELSLSAGKAYVQGYEIEKIKTTKLDIAKALTTKKKTDESLYAPYGVYIDVTYDSITGDSAQGIFNTDARSVVYLNSAVDGAGNTIASTRILSITRFGSNMRIWLEWSPTIEDFLTSAKSITNVDGTTGDIWANIESFNSDGQTTEHGLLFDPIRQPIESFDDNRISYTVQKSFKDIAVNGSIEYVITADTLYTDFVNSGLVVLAKSSTDATNPFEIQASGDYTYTVDGNGNDSVLATLTITPTGFTADNIDVVVQVLRRKTNAKTKTLTEQIITEEPISGTSITLAHYDAYKITKIESKVLVGDAYVEETDISGYTLNVNDKDSYYDLSEITGFTDAKYYRVTYLYFAHSGSGDCFNVDSYIHATNTTLEPNIYTDLGYYTAENGKKFDLINTFDFRRTVFDLDNGGVYTITPRTSINFDYNYYLSQISQISLSNSGEFVVSNSIPAWSPVTPTIPQNNMPLYTLYIPAYTFNVSDIRIQEHDRRRFTMNDIRKIRNRVEKIEYYTAISMLEKQASEMNIIDTQGFNKFKNGILVDSFSNHDIGDHLHDDYNNSMDYPNGIVRSPYTQENIEFDPVSIPAGIKLNTNTTTLDYTTERVIYQPYATTTINVNPFDVVYWEGDIILDPPIDNWFETVILPTQLTYVIDGRVMEILPTTLEFPTTFAEIDLSGSSTFNSTAVSVQSSAIPLTALSSEWTVESDTEFVSRTNSEYMRAKDITFTGTGFKANTALDIFFDDVNINQYCTPNGLTLGDTVSTDDTGNIEGVFSIPEHTFKTGTVIFRVVDAVAIHNPYTSGSTEFMAEGSKAVYESTLTYKYTTPTPPRPTFVLVGDPLAQSFYVEEDGGIFLDNIDVFFQTKSADVPISVRIVTIDTGYPTSTVLENSTVVLTPDLVNVSNDSSVATTFTFSDPIYLQGKTEYAFIVIADTDEYECYISEMGENDLLSGNRIVKQPYLGSMFTSQNATTWTAEQNSDIKFNINKCVFGLGSVEMEFKNDETLLSQDTYATLLGLKFDSINLTGTNLEYNYQFTGGDKTAIKNRNNTNLEAQQYVSLDGTTSECSIFANLQTSSANLTPIISNHGQDCIFINNEVTDIVGEPTYKDAGVYLTNKVNLITPSDDVHVYVDAKLPSSARLKMYYATDNFIPKYVEIDPTSIGHPDFRTNTNYVYWHNETTNVWTLKGSVVTTGIDVDSSPDRIYLSSVSDYDMFLNSADFVANNIDAIYIVEQVVDTPTIDDWNSGTSYNINDYVFYNDVLYVAELSSLNSIPTDDSLDWLVVKSTSTTTILIDDIERSWREMELLNEISDEINTADNFVEYHYKPKEYPDQEFTTFAIKIEMQSVDPVNIPYVKNFRALAVM